MAVLGTGLVVSAAADGEGALAVIGALLGGLGILGLVLAVSRWRSGRGAIVESDGRVLHVRGSRVALLTRTATLVWLALCCAAGAAMAESSDATVLAIALAIAAAALGALVVAPILSGLPADRLELSPDGIVVGHHGGQVQMAWEHVLGTASPRPSPQPLPIVMKEQERIEATRGWALWQDIDVLDEQIVGLPVVDLPIHPVLLALVISRCAQEPALRSQIGTPASCDWRTWPPR